LILPVLMSSGKRVEGVLRAYFGIHRLQTMSFRLLQSPFVKRRAAE
jgi:hypothetical protein